MKTKISLVLALGFISLTAATLNAQVAINNSASNPNASAILDLNTGNAGVNKGFLAPQVALTNVATAAPVTGPATGLIVYTTTAPTGGNGTGYYYWNGAAWASLNSTINGAGTLNYVARWTPNGTTLGTGMIQDNGITVGINMAPQAGSMLYVNSTTGNAIYGTSTLAGSTGVFGMGDTGISAYGNGTLTAGIGISALSPTNVGVWSNGGYGGIYGAGVEYAFFGLDGAGDEAIIANQFFDDAYYGTGTVNGMDITGTSGIGVNATGGTYGVSATGTTAAGYFYNSTGNYAYAGYNGYGLYGFSTTAYPTGAGVYGEDDAGGYGVWGVDTTLASVGVNGDGNVDYSEGVQARTETTYGYPLVGWYDYNATTQSLAPMVYGLNSYSGTAVMMNYYDGTTQWKITDGGGGGSVGTVVKTNTGEKVRLVCPETPEIIFEDYGTGQLVNGRVHIALDPTIVKNVTISDRHPLKVFIQLEGECNGVYVGNKTASGFDVIELNHGASNVSFSWHIVANRADEAMNHGLVSHNADMRFPKVNEENEKKLMAQMQKQPTKSGVKPASVAQAKTKVEVSPTRTASSNQMNKPNTVIQK